MHQLITSFDLHFSFTLQFQQNQLNVLGFIGSYLSIKYAAKRLSNILMSSFLKLGKTEKQSKFAQLVEYSKSKTSSST